jgi:hypothetical protein
MTDAINTRFSKIPKWVYSKWLKIVSLMLFAAIAINFMYGINKDVVTSIESEENIQELVSILHTMSECFIDNNDSICLPRLAAISMLLDKAPTSTVLSGKAYDIAELLLNSKHLENKDPGLHTRLIMWGYYDKLITDERKYLPPDRDKIYKFQKELKLFYEIKLKQIDEKINNR